MYTKEIEKWLRQHYIVIILYILASMLEFYFILGNITRYAIGFGSDTFQALWFIFWTRYAISNHLNLFNTDLIYYPVGANLLVNAYPVLTYLLAAVISSISNIVFAYNILKIFGLAFSAFMMYLLAYKITNNKYAAFFSGFIFAFGSFSLIHSLGELDMEFSGFLPLSLLALINIIDSKSTKKVILNSSIIGLSLTLVYLMNNIEFIVFDSLLLLAYLLVYIVTDKEKRAALISKVNLSSIKISKIYLAIIVVSITFIITSIWLLYPTYELYREYRYSLAGVSSVAQYALYSNNLLSFFIIPYFNGIFYPLTNGYGLFNGSASCLSILTYTSVTLGTERTAFIGYSVILLVMYAIYRFRSKVIPDLLVALFFMIVSLGPYITLGPYGASCTQPYSQNLPPDNPLFDVFNSIPLVNAVREYDRYFVISLVALSIIAAIALSDIIDRSNNRRSKLIVLSLLLIVFVLGNNLFPTNSYLTHFDEQPIEGISSRFYDTIANISSNFTVLPLPATPVTGVYPNLYLSMNMYFESIYKKPILTGYTSRVTPQEENLLYTIPLAIQADTALFPSLSINYSAVVNENFSNVTLLSLYNYRTAFVVINLLPYLTQENFSGFQKLYSYLYSLFGYPVYDGNTTMAFFVLNKTTEAAYRSYVAYTYPQYWPRIQIYNSSLDFYTPLAYNGSSAYIIVYAPCNSSISIAECSSSYIERPTRISFYARSLNLNNPQLNSSVDMNIYEYNKGAQRKIFSGYIDGDIKQYIINTTMLEGANPNILVFSYNSNGVIPLITNITFSSEG
ncbi:MAG: hypothetical protein ARM1_0497 [Candidatus Micrarchaeota archaeon]|nr:MAG: hypothetical protein ARM1_0497 [Candidatus Micrarchaeota archaeon]